MIAPLTRRQALGALLAPIVAAGCSFDAMLAPERRRLRLLSLDATVPEITLVGSGCAHAKGTIGNTGKTGAMVHAAVDANPNARAFMVGDLVQNGLEAEYGYYDGTGWGAVKDRTDFQIGNKDLLLDPTGRWWHEYTGVGELGRYYYAKTYGRWRVYYLDSQTGAWDEQTAWLADDLPQWSETHHVLAMWHQPMFASVCQHNGKAMTRPGKLGPWWDLLAQHGCEGVVSAHAHRYERFAPMLRSGVESVAGVRQFIAGTGGPTPMPIQTDGVHPGSQRQVISRGVMKFDLYADRYEWAFTDLAGVIRDSGVQACRKELVA